MNIFVVSKNPIECAVALDDRRVVKMITETAQMLSTALARHGGEPFYRPCYHHHPCTIWVGEDRSNFTWALFMMTAMNDEYKRRYDKRYDHLAYHKALLPCIDQLHLIPHGQGTPFANCSLFKDEPNIIEAYRKTMIHKWANFKMPPKWTNATKPDWAS